VLFYPRDHLYDNHKFTENEILTQKSKQ